MVQLNCPFTSAGKHDVMRVTPRPRRTTVEWVTVPRSRVAAMVLLILAAASCGQPTHPPAATGVPAAATAPELTSRADFAAVSSLVDDAIAAHRLPGAVVQIGHAGTMAFRRAFGARKLDGEPGLDGSPAPAEPMTEDTIFDLASLTKSIATTTAVLQLYEQGRVRIDDAVQTYLPGFNPADDPRRAGVTLRMLLTHTSGIAGDLSLDGPWGLDHADKPEGLRRALGAWVVFEPGQTFHYSDINFILVGAIIETITGEPLDRYVQRNVFAPLGMTDTHYLPVDKVCGPHQIRGAAVALGGYPPWMGRCPEGTWSTALLARVAPTSRDGDTPGINPDHGHLLRGTVHDPTARRMGGVTGSAGVFSTTRDIGRFAQALLDRRAGRPSTFPLAQSTVELMTTPQQPAAAGEDLRGFGWDIDTEQSRPRGTIFPVGSFGHTGFTGVTLWMDPGSDTYVIILANVIHQPGGPPIAGLSGEVATAAAEALGLYRR